LALRAQIMLVIETPAGSSTLHNIVRCRDAGRYPPHDCTLWMPLARSAWVLPVLPAKERPGSCGRQECSHDADTVTQRAAGTLAS
jgi:hypothetical protein